MTQIGGSEPPLPPTPTVVFFVYGLAAVAILVASVLAVAILHAAEPDLAPDEILRGLRGLIATALASSAALLGTCWLATRRLTLAQLRLVPARERGRDLAVAIVGVLALGQALDSLTIIAGVAERGTMQAIRQALSGVSGPDLFAAVLVIGPIAGTAEEVFFRGYMQSMLRARWPAAVAIVVTSVGFALLHFDWVHGVLAFALGLYLGLCTEVTGSALPAVAGHVVNNSLFTLLTALVGSLPGVQTNVVLLLVTGVIFIGCVAWLARLPK